MNKIVREPQAQRHYCRVAGGVRVKLTSRMNPCSRVMQVISPRALKEPKFDGGKRRSN